MARHFATVDEYVATFPLEVQLFLQNVRQAIRRAVPGAVENIAYQTPYKTEKGIGRFTYREPIPTNSSSDS